MNQVTQLSDFMLLEYKKLVKQAFRDLLTDVVQEAATGCAFNNVKPNMRMLSLTVYSFLRVVVPSDTSEEIIIGTMCSNNNKDTDNFELFDRLVDAIITDTKDVNPTIYRMLKTG